MSREETAARLDADPPPAASSRGWIRRLGQGPAAVALRIAAGLLLLAFVLGQADFSELEITWSTEVFAGAAGAVALLGIALLFSALRWRLVLPQDGPSLLTLWRVYLIGWFFSLFLPTSVGGDAVRVVAVARGGTSTGEALSSIVVERLLGMFALVVYLVIGLLVAPTVLEGAMQQTSFTLRWWHLAVVAAVGCLALLGAGVLARRSSRVRRLLREAGEVVVRFREAPARLAGASAASLVVQALYILTWYVLASVLALEVPFLVFLVFVPFVSLVAMLPVTIAGLGLREGAWVVLLQPFGVAVASAVVFSLLYYGASLVLGLVGGVLFMLSGLRADRRIQTDRPALGTAGDTRL